VVKLKAADRRFSHIPWVAPRHLVNTIEFVAFFGPPESITQTASQSLQAVFAQFMSECRLASGGMLFPCKVILSHGDLYPHLICGSLGPPKSSTQTASRSCLPFWHGSLVWQTDRQTTLLGR